MAVNVGSAVGYLDLDISGFIAGLTTAQTQANTKTKSMVTQVGNNVTALGQKFTAAGTALTTTVTLPILALGTAAVKTTSNFESAMSKVSAISGATGSDLEALSQKAQQMGATTKFTASEAASAFTYMAMAGWKTEDMLAGIEGIMSLAAADGLDLATTSDIVTDALTAFGLGAEDSSHFADVLAKASSSANTNVSMLGESFKYVAPVAGSLGYSVEDVGIALGLMANSGIKGSQAGTTLRQSLNNLIKPTDDAAAMMKKYGIEIANADGSMKPLGDVMDMLRNKLGGLSAEEQAVAASTLFGTRSMAGMLAIINASDSDYQGLTDSIYGADGAAKDMADTMLNNLNGQVTLLKSALEGLAIQFGEILLPYIKQFVSWVQSLVVKLQNLTPEQKEQVVKWAAIVASIGPALLIFGKVMTAVGGLITTLGNLKNAIAGAKSAISAIATAIGGLSASAAWIIAIIVAVIAAFVTLMTTNEEFRNKIISIFTEVRDNIVNTFAQITESINSLGFDFENFGQVLWALWLKICELLGPGLMGIFNHLANDIKHTLDLILGIVNFFVALFKGDWEGCWEAIKSILVSTWNFIVNWLKIVIVDVLLGTIDVILGWFGTSWAEIWEAVKTFFVNIWNSIVSWFQGVLNGIATFFQNIWNGISTFFQNIWNGIATFFQNIWNGIVNTVQTAWNGMMGILSTVGNWIYTNVIAPVLQFFTDLWNGIVNAFHTVIDPWIEIVRRLTIIFYNDVILPIQQFFIDLWNSIVSGLQAAWDWVVQLLSTVANWVNTNVIQPIVNFFVNLWNSIISGLQTVWNWIVSLLLTVANWVNTNVVQPVVSLFTSLWNTISTAASNCWNAVVAIWNVVSGWFNDKIITPVKNIFTNMWNGLKNGAKNAWEGVKSTFSTVATFFGDIFKKAWEKVKKVFSTGGKIFTGIKDGIVTAFKKVVNVIIDGINKVVSIPFNGLNSILNTISGVSIVGVKPFSWLTWRAPIPQIPKLAKGAVLPPNNPFLAVVGDQTRGTNVEAPLSTIQEAVALVIKGFAYSIMTLQRVAIGLLAESRDELGYIAYNGFTKPERTRNKSTNPEQNNPEGGDTFIFNSPKPIDEIEAAKRMKQAKRELAEGF